MAIVDSGKGLPDAATAAPFKVHTCALIMLSPAFTRGRAQVHNAFQEDGSHVPAIYRGMKLVDDEYERVSALGEGTYGTVRGSCIVLAIARISSHRCFWHAPRRIPRSTLPSSASVWRMKRRAFPSQQSGRSNCLRFWATSPTPKMSSSCTMLCDPKVCGCVGVGHQWRAQWLYHHTTSTHATGASTATKQNQFKPAIYMVFEYMDHDLTGLMERCNYNFKVTQVRTLSHVD